MLNTADLAKRFGLTTIALRPVLRSMLDYSDGMHTRYEWHESNPMIDMIRRVVEQRKMKAPTHAEDQTADRLAKYLKLHMPDEYKARTRACLLYRIAI
jgi:hypothetical protein